MVSTAESPAAARHFSPASLLRSRFVNTSWDDGGSPYNTEAGSRTNKKNLFQGPGFIKHIYVLTQQDEFETSLTVPTLANWNEADVTFYDTSSTTYTDFESPIYKQVIPMGIPDGFLQEIVDDIRQKYNAFILWIDSNLIGEYDGNATASQNCAGFGSAGTYTGTLVQECGDTSTNLANCRKLNKMICSFNWGLDKIVDYATGYFYGLGGATEACAGAASTSDTGRDVDDYGTTLTAKGNAGGCGGTDCTKLNDLICKVNWAMVFLDTNVVGKKSGCEDGTDVDADWRTGTPCPATTCTGMNKILCKIYSGLSKVGFSFAVDELGFSFAWSWYFFPDAISMGTLGIPAYIDWSVPIRNNIRQDWAPKKDFIDLGNSDSGLAPQFDFDNYNRNQGFQISFPEPGLYVSKGLTVMQNTDNDPTTNNGTGTRAPAHINVIFQQASTAIDAKTGGVLNV